MSDRTARERGRIGPMNELMDFDLPRYGPGLATLLRLLGQINVGQLAVVLPGGARRVFTGRKPGPRAVMEIHATGVARAMLFGGTVGFAEAYMKGDWDSPDLTALLELASLNERHLDERLRGSPFARFLGRIKHLLNNNSKRGSRRNIVYHYDLGNRFYDKWLDPSMTYSSALFSDERMSLTGAQNVKYKRLAEIADVTPGSRVLEIGCGWGGFAEIAIRDFGASVTGLTLSDEQKAYTQTRLARAGMADRADIRLQDYRDVEGDFDALVSIEMFEAVGEAQWPVYFKKVYERLKPGAKAALQIITIEDRRFESYRKGADFIQRYIFPGGMLPSPAVLSAQIARAGLIVTHTEYFGQDYAETLRRWQIRFQRAWREILPLGFDQRFRRMWEYYLSYCEAGFRTGAVNVVHLGLQKPSA